MLLLYRRSRGTIKEPIQTSEKTGGFFLRFLPSTNHLDLWGVLFSSWLFFVLFKVFNVLCLTCNHRYVAEGWLSYSYSELLAIVEGEKDITRYADKAIHSIV